MFKRQVCLRGGIFIDKTPERHAEKSCVKMAPCGHRSPPGAEPATDRKVRGPGSSSASRPPPWKPHFLGDFGVANTSTPLLSRHLECPLSFSPVIKTLKRTSWEEGLPGHRGLRKRSSRKRNRFPHCRSSPSLIRGQCSPELFH